MPHSWLVKYQNVFVRMRYPVSAVQNHLGYRLGLLDSLHITTFQFKECARGVYFSF